MKKKLLAAVAAAVFAVGGVTTGLVVQRSGTISPKIVYRPGSVSTTNANNYVVPASYMGNTIYNDCSHAVATVLNAWMATVPDGSTIQFAANGCYLLDNALQLQSRNNLTISGNGATFDSGLTEGQTGTKDYVPWYVNGGTNITLKNMSVVGTSTALPHCVGDGCGTSTICQPSGAFEFQYGVEYAGTVGGNITNVNISQMCGEFIDFYPYCNGSFTISGGCQGTEIWTDPVENVIVNGGTDSVAGQQGLVVTDASNVTFENVNASWIGANGIDVEPDTTIGYTNGLTFDNNTFTGVGDSMFNESGGGDLGSGNVTVDNNTWTAAVGCDPLAAVNASGVSPVPSGFTIDNNTGAPLALQYSVANVDNVQLEGNSTTYTGGTSCFNYAVSASNIVNATMTGNVFYANPGSTLNQPTAVYSASNVTGTVQICGNTVAKGSGRLPLAQQPVAC